MSDEIGRRKINPNDNVIKMINQLLAEWGLNPEEIKDTEENIWYLKQGSTNFQIELYDYDRGDRLIPYIEVRGIIMKLPVGDISNLSRRVLELNCSGPGCSFGIRNNLLLLRSAREIEHLDYQEFKNIVDDIRFYSDFWENRLKQEFGLST